MATINSISADVPCTQETGIYKTKIDYFSDKSTHDNLIIHQMFKHLGRACEDCDYTVVIAAMH